MTEPAKPRPNWKILILQAVIIAIVSVIAAVLVKRMTKEDVIPAIVGGLVAGVLALIFMKRSNTNQHKNNPER